MTVIVDYGVGNLFSLLSSLHYIGENARISSNPEEIANSDRIILPGVGAFGDAALKLNQTGLAKAVKAEAKKGKPLMGICLGMQLLFDQSYEYGNHKGLGLIPGEIRPISQKVPSELKIPHIGWNPLLFSSNSSSLFKYIHNHDCVYFVHSYQAICPEEYILARSEYGALLTAAVSNGNVFGCQFHPEKSGQVGLHILKSFCEMEDTPC